MDKENVNLHCGIRVNYIKQWCNEICSQMHGTGKDHPEWSNPKPERKHGMFSFINAY